MKARATPDLFSPRPAGLRFFLGTGAPHWLALLDVPLFVARQRFALRCKRRRPRARTRWAMDSGGFSACSAGGWTITPQAFVAEVEALAADVGLLEWAAPMDWMCEPEVLLATGLDVAEHQRRTVANLLEVRALARTVHFIPVLQGWVADDYLRCADAYAAAGVDLAREPIVGVGTVCRRQATDGARRIVHALRAHVSGIRLHGFGFKIRGLEELASDFDSADSTAWSYGARNAPKLDGCTHGGRNCAHCTRYALEWRTRLASKVLISS